MAFIRKSRRLNIPELESALDTIEKWSIPISNYHVIRYTNAPIEGRNNKIKSLVRRGFFLSNRENYENRIYQECNKEQFQMIQRRLFGKRYI